MIPTGLAWEDMLYPLYQKYKNAITWGDQDLLNIIFYFNPGRFSFENAVGGLLHPPPHPEHILALGHPWWSLNGACVPCLSVPFHPPPGSHTGGPCTPDTKGQMLKPPTRALHFPRVSFRSGHAFLLRSTRQTNGRPRTKCKRYYLGSRPYRAWTMARLQGIASWNPYS